MFLQRAALGILLFNLLFLQMSMQNSLQSALVKSAVPSSSASPIPVALFPPIFEACSRYTRDWSVGCRIFIQVNALTQLATQQKVLCTFRSDRQH
jgi:hypothetical protein